MASQRIEVPHWADIDLGTGQERAHPDIDGETALDSLDHAANDHFAIGVGFLHLVPDLHLLGLLARQHDVTFPILRALQQHVDRVTGLHRHLSVLVDELADRDDAFRFVADVDDDFGVRHVQNGALDDFTFRNVPEAAIVQAQETSVLGGIDLIFAYQVHQRLAWVGSHRGLTFAC